MRDQIKYLTGQKFGRLTVIELYPKRNKTRNAQWVCLCECGTRKVITGNKLGKDTKSCGCLHRELASARCKERIYKKIDLTNRKFGRLLVIKRVQRLKNNDYKWNCICDCGRQTNTCGSNLLKGRAKSCGCLRIEKVRMASSNPIFKARRRMRLQQYNLNKKLNFQCIKVEKDKL